MARTTINCATETKAWFDELRPDAASSEDEFLTALLRHYDETTEQDALFATEQRVVSLDELKNELSMANEPGAEIDTEALINRIDDLETELTRQHEGLKR